MWKQIKKNYNQICDNEYRISYISEYNEPMYLIFLLAIHYRYHKNNIVRYNLSPIFYRDLYYIQNLYKKMDVRIDIFRNFELALIEPTDKQLFILKLFNSIEKNITLWNILFISTVILGILLYPILLAISLILVYFLTDRNIIMMKLLKKFSS